MTVGLTLSGDRAEAALQLADPEPAASLVVAERPREVEQRRAPRHVTIDERRMLRIERGAVEIHLPRHRPVVRLSFPVVRRGEQAHARGMAGDDGRGRDRLDRLVAVLQIFTELVDDEGLPVDVVGVGEDRAHPARLDLVPRA